MHHKTLIELIWNERAGMFSSLLIDGNPIRTDSMSLTQTGFGQLSLQLTIPLNPEYVDFEINPEIFFEQPAEELPNEHPTDDIPF